MPVRLDAISAIEQVADVRLLDLRKVGWSRRDMAVEHLSRRVSFIHSFVAAQCFTHQPIEDAMYQPVCTPSFQSQFKLVEKAVRRA